MANARGRILVVNPNSNRAVTDLFSAALDCLRFADGPEIVCETLAEGPLGIQSEADIAAVTLPLRKLVQERQDADAFVLACYADPGLFACREATKKPVFGIHACGALMAMTQGDRYGVLALSTAAIGRHIRYLRQLGLLTCHVGERALDLSVAESAQGGRTFDRLVEVGTALRDQNGANVLVLGCAGLSRHRKPLEDKLGVPVVDPVMAAVTMAIGAVAAGRSAL